MSSTFEFLSADGIRLRGWCNDGAGPPLIVSPGLGTVPQMWPSLVGADSGYSTFTWYHRGTFGSTRPAELSRVRVRDHAEDLVALMDSRGIERALVAGWSLGVDVGFEVAQRHPDRVAGLLAVAGIPGGTFTTMGAPLRIPRGLRRPLATAIARLGRRSGPVLNWLAARTPLDRRTAWLLSHSGFMLPGAEPESLLAALAAFLRQDWGWYYALALAATEHRPLDLSLVQCPATLLVARQDVLTSMRAILDAAPAIPDARTLVLSGSHFVPLEHPEVVVDALAALFRRCSLYADRLYAADS
ncbi:MAG: alpha/beta hydrolase [Actinobacteria bacterium]|nr:alpha/beta hydrolase [Actinomycetota bacterium]MBW3647098.1 alpha/beta hydrolase [Actinomycetota bacterium]